MNRVAHVRTKAGRKTIVIEIPAAVAIGGTPGAVIGTLLARHVDKHHKDYYQDQVENGGILLWVRVADPEKQDIAVKILEGHSGKDVHVHDWSA